MQRSYIQPELKSQAHRWLRDADLPVSTWGLVTLRLKAEEEIIRIFHFPDGSFLELRTLPNGQQEWTARNSYRD